MAKSWACPCGRRNSNDRDTCVDCERAKPDRPEREKAAARPRQCSLDGGTLDDKGFCSVGQGYVATVPCPFACPHCRHLLTWDGRCFACFGTSTGKREDWTIPGDRYEIQKGHWQLVEKGPHPVCSYEQHVEALRVVGAVYRGEMSVEQAHEMLTLLVPQ